MIALKFKKYSSPASQPSVDFSLKVPMKPHDESLFTRYDHNLLLSAFVAKSLDKQVFFRLPRATKAKIEGFHGSPYYTPIRRQRRSMNRMTTSRHEG